MNIETIIIIALILMAFIGAGVCLYIYLRDKSLNEIRADVYQLFLEAEHRFTESKSGKQKMKYVISQARALLPSWAQLLISEDFLQSILEYWFQMVKDLLDDGKMNKSQEGK